MSESINEFIDNVEFVEDIKLIYDATNGYYTCATRNNSFKPEIRFAGGERQSIEIKIIDGDGDVMFSFPYPYEKGD